MSTTTKHVPEFDATAAMSIRELRDRLTAIIDSHDAQGWGERNDQPVMMRVPQTPTPGGRRRRSFYVPIAKAAEGSLGLLTPSNSRVFVSVVGP